MRGWGSTIDSHACNTVPLVARNSVRTTPQGEEAMLTARVPRVFYDELGGKADRLGETHSALLRIVLSDALGVDIAETPLGRPWGRLRAPTDERRVTSSTHDAKHPHAV